MFAAITGIIKKCCADGKKEKWKKTQTKTNMADNEKTKILAGIEFGGLHPSPPNVLPDKISSPMVSCSKF